MAPWTRRTPRRRARIERPALTASAQQIDRENSARERQQMTNERRNQRALSFYSTLGEIWYPANNFGRVMSRIRWFPALLEDGEPVEVTEGPLLDLFERIQDPGGGSRSQLAASYGVLDFVIGEGLLTVTVEDGQEQWEFLSPLELSILPDDDGYQRKAFPGATPQVYRMAADQAPTEGEARVWRLWRRHPAYSGVADSPVKSVLEPCELLQWLRLAAASSAASRAAQRGGLYIPEELTFGEEPNPVTDEDIEQADDFTERLTEALSNAIKNPGTAEAASPFVIRGPAALPVGDSYMPTVDLLKWFPLGPEGDSYGELEATEKVIDAIANGVDLPKPWVTGDTGADNHWGGWLVDEQAYRVHIAPVAERFGRDLASAYLRPAARDAGVAEWQEVVIWHDPAAAINHPDEIKTAQQAYKDAIVGPGYYRDKIGAKETDAPTDDEVEVIFALQGKTPPGEEPQGALAPQDGGRGGDVVEEPPAPALTAARVIGVLEATVERARELAGNRLWTKAQGCEPCRESMQPVPRAGAAHALGRPLVADILRDGTDETALVAGAGRGAVATLVKFGLDADIAVQLGHLAEQHAARTLYDPEPPSLPPGVHSVVAKAIR